jgi:hypothetical protein
MVDLSLAPERLVCALERGGCVPTIEEFIAIAARHSHAEAEDDLAATLATLDDEPVYELLPVGRRLVGRERTERYYRWFFADFNPRIVGYELRGDWTNEVGVVHEFTIQVRGDDGTVESHSLMGILVYGERGLAGERVYGTERILRMIFGPLYDVTEPMWGD